MLNDHNSTNSLCSYFYTCVSLKGTKIIKYDWKKIFTYSLDILSILPVISRSLKTQLPLSFPSFTSAFSAAAVSTHKAEGEEKKISRCFTQLLYVSFLKVLFCLKSDWLLCFPFNIHIYRVQHIIVPADRWSRCGNAVRRNYAERCPHTAVGRGLRGIIWTAIICSSVARLLKFAAQMKIPGPLPLTWLGSYACLIE